MHAVPRTYVTVFFYFLNYIFPGAVNEDFKLRKTQKFTFLKIQKTQNTVYNQNNETGEPKINTAIC